MAQIERIQQIKTFLKDNPKDAFLNYALATEYVSTGNDADARAIFEELIHSQPNYFATYYHLAKLYERLNLDEKAEETYEEGIRISRELGEKHAQRELQSALDELVM